MSCQDMKYPVRTSSSLPITFTRSHLMQRSANFSTLMLLCLKDIRLERGIHQAHVAQAVGKTPSAWAKIESGQSPLQFDTFIGACVGLTLNPAHMMQTVERLMAIFNRHNWYFQAADLGGEDELLPLMQEYFASSGFEALKSRPWHRQSILSFSSMLATAFEPTIAQYCCIPEAKGWIDSGAPAEATITPQSSLSLVTTAVAGRHF